MLARGDVPKIESISKKPESKSMAIFFKKKNCLIKGKLGKYAVARFTNIEILQEQIEEKNKTAKLQIAGSRFVA